MERLGTDFLARGVEDFGRVGITICSFIFEVLICGFHSKLCDFVPTSISGLDFIRDFHHYSGASRHVHLEASLMAQPQRYFTKVAPVNSAKAFPPDGVYGHASKRREYAKFTDQCAK